MPQRSAGILLYRLTDAAPEVLPVHPGGPFWAKNDDGAWSIPAKTQSRHRARGPLAELLPCEEDAVQAPMRKERAFAEGLVERVSSIRCGSCREPWNVRKTPESCRRRY
jgi:predicted NUDIX family NTP pyrophosphohydrolase